MGWYKSGAVTVENGNAIVVGEATDFLVNVKAGFAFLGPDNEVYEVLSSDSAGGLTLASPYRGESAEGQAYNIFPTQGTIKDLSTQVAALMNTFGVIRDLYEAGGLVGAGLELKAILESADDLPDDPAVGDAYMVGTLIYVFCNDDTWHSSDIRGPAGPGNVLTIGTVTSGAAASATITGDSPEQTLNLVLPKGDTGPANTLEIGSVTSGEVALAEIEGDAPNQTLNLVLPKGDTGPANTLEIGSVTSAGAAAATIEGDAPNQTLNLVLPKGDIGPGNTLAIGTVVSGEVAQATIEGYSPEQTLNLVLPKGDVGDRGPAGITPAGAWDAESAYQVNDTVLYAGSQWRRLVDGTTPGTPDADETNWEIFASKGADGTGSGTVTAINGVSPDVSGNVALDADDVGEGITNKYFSTGRVLGVVLSGLSFLQSTAVVATDTIFVAIGKLQKQITDLYSWTGDASISATRVITLQNNTTSRSNIGLGTTDDPTFGSLTVTSATGAVIKATGAFDFPATASLIAATTTDMGLNGAGSSQSNNIKISGNATITSFGNAPNAGALRFVKFFGAPLITHNPSTLILPTGQNIQASPKDAAIFRALDTSGGWECLHYTSAKSVPGRFLGRTVYSCATQDFTVSGNILTLALAAGNRSMSPFQGCPVRLTTTGVLPEPLLPNTTYYAGARTVYGCTLTLMPGGPAITLTDAGTGIHTITNAPYNASLKGANTLIIELIAAGGGGGGAASAACAGGGGASGNSARVMISGLNSSAADNVVVTGLGGSGGSASGTAGNTGGDTSMRAGAPLLSVKGGIGGAGSTVASTPKPGGTSQWPGSITDFTGLGSSAYGTLQFAAASPGGMGFISGTTKISGAGGCSPLGGGGQSMMNTSSAAVEGFQAFPNSGSGGSGACAGSSVGAAGGAGANGIVIVDEYS